MIVDVEIYMNNLQKFFKDNQNDLLNLIPIEKEKDFYVKIREVATKNYEDGKDVSLTRNQLIEICVELNGKKTTEKEFIDKRVFVETKFGLICKN